MTTKRPGFQTYQMPAFSVPVRPIGDADLVRLQVAMAEIAPDWSVELQGICADEATLVVLPDGGDDAVGPSFVVSRESYRFRLDQVHWDVVTELGAFVSLDDVAAALGVRLAFYSEATLVPSATVH